MRMRSVASAAALFIALSACSGGGADVASGPAIPTVIASASPSAGCEAVYRFPAEGRKHVARGTTVDYNTQPPTSGNHFQIWGATGVYAQTVPDELLVHNLEHGQVVFWYTPGRVSKEILDGLVALVKRHKTFSLLVPRPADKFVPAAALAFTAWQTMQRCPTPTADAVGAASVFLNQHIQKGPEKIPGDPVFETPPLK